jgi:hypothetical protein
LSKGTNWFEVWADAGLMPPYVLVLLFEGVMYSLYDPRENMIIQKFSEYELARKWLLEDAYELVRGKVIIS